MHDAFMFSWALEKLVAVVAGLLRSHRPPWQRSSQAGKPQLFLGLLVATHAKFQSPIELESCQFVHMLCPFHVQRPLCASDHVGSEQ